MVYYICI